MVSRHAGALEWLRCQGIEPDHFVAHLEGQVLTPGDIVIGTLPLHLACWVCEQGAEYWHLSLDIPARWRGHELTSEQMNACQARFECFKVERLAGDACHSFRI
ncbi:CRISPR-associated protein Csx16 [Halomonas sp.]|uniref:CRISPR-associated protein Csx16 n=1 Tax=Halomonas sp. TaxID=1486246 RepID=UPI00384DF341